MWQLAPLFAVVAAFVASAFAVEVFFGRPGFLELHLVAPRLLAGLALYMPFLVLYYATRITFIERGSVREVQFWRAFAAENLSPRNVLPALALLTVLGPLMSTFVSYKALIPEINPFSWDAAFMKADYWLHSGNHPWQLLFPWFGGPRMLSFLDSVYLMWFPVLVMTVVWQAWSGKDPLRGQFFLTFSLIWIVLGVGVAIAWSSAGPCYYSEVVGGPSTYDTLMSHLESVNQIRPLAALDIQDILWRDYAGLAEHKIEGISAMPSIHVAMAALLVLLFSRVHFLAGIAAGGFATLILIGSIMLGWHYAVDGYIGAALVLPLWWLSGRAQRAMGAIDAR